MPDQVGGGAALVSPPPDPEVLRRLRPCVGALLQQPDRFVTLLHHHVRALVAGGVEHLAEQGWPICERTARAVLIGATGEHPASTVEAMLQQAGVDNFRDGFPGDQYLAVGHALLRAVHDAYPSEWSTSLGSSWIAYFVWVRTHLLRGGTAAQELQWAQEEHSAAVSRPPQPVAAGEEDFEEDFDDEDEDEDGYGEIMVSMTLGSRREPDYPVRRSR